MGPPPSNVVSPVVALVVRILTFICVLISIIVLTTNTVTVETTSGDAKFKFKDFYAYRYLLATTVFGLAYTLLQTALTVFQVSTGNRIGGDLRLQFDFFGDKIISYALATGAAASFGMTQDLRRVVELDSDLNNFLNVANAAASMCLLAFVFCAISSIFSAYSLPKKA